MRAAPIDIWSRTAQTAASVLLVDVASCRPNEFEREPSGVVGPAVAAERTTTPTMDEGSVLMTQAGVGVRPARSRPTEV